jgi:hypothetical protein
LFGCETTTGVHAHIFMSAVANPQLFRGFCSATAYWCIRNPSFFSSLQLFKQALLRNYLSALPQLIAEVRAKKLKNSLSGISTRAFHVVEIDLYR